MAKVTILDVATEAGVSPATVDRALHSRGGVGQAARLRITQAIRTLGYGAASLNFVEGTKPQVTLRLILPLKDRQFPFALRNAFKMTCASISHADVDLQVDTAGAMRPEGWNDTALAAALKDAVDQGVDAIAAFAIDTPTVVRAIDACADIGIPLVTILSDAPSSKRQAFVGMDNHAAGRTAGRLIGKFIGQNSGKVALLTGPMKHRDHVERCFGFRKTLGQFYRNLSLLPVAETNNSDRSNMETIAAHLAAHDDLVGIYLTGGGALGVLTALRDLNPSKRPAFVCHDLSRDVRQGLMSDEIDAALDQNVQLIAQKAVAQLVAHAHPTLFALPAEHTEIPVEIFVAENL